MVSVLSSELSGKLSDLISDPTTCPMTVRAARVDAPSPQTPQAEGPLGRVMQIWFLDENTDLTDVAGVILLSSPGLVGVVSVTPKRWPCAAGRKRTHPQQDGGDFPDSAPVAKKSCPEATDAWEDTVAIDCVVVNIPCPSVNEGKEIQSRCAIDLGDNDELQSLLDAAPDPLDLEGIELDGALVDLLNYIAIESRMV